MLINTFTPQRVKPFHLNSRESDGSYYSRSASNPSSNVSSALPSPTESSNKNFDFSLFLESIKSKRVEGESELEHARREIEMHEEYFASDEGHDDRAEDIKLTPMPDLDEETITTTVTMRSSIREQVAISSGGGSSGGESGSKVKDRGLEIQIPKLTEDVARPEPLEKTLCNEEDDGKGGDVTEEEVSTPCASTCSNTSQAGFEFPSNSQESPQKEQN